MVYLVNRLGPDKAHMSPIIEKEYITNKTLGPYKPPLTLPPLSFSLSPSLPQRGSAVALRLAGEGAVDPLPQRPGRLRARAPLV
jgi:hypothetical protein